jgi:hypothetical protein
VNAPIHKTPSRCRRAGSNFEPTDYESGARRHRSSNFLPVALSGRSDWRVTDRSVPAMGLGGHQFDNVRRHAVGGGKQHGIGVPDIPARCGSPPVPDQRSDGGLAVAQVGGDWREAVPQGVRDDFRGQLGRPRVLPEVEGRVRAELAKGTGVLKTARALGLGTGTVQRIKRDITTAR